ncbi:N/A [soil metagenome]
MTEQVKIVVTVPVADADTLRRAIGEAGAGVVGDYSFCSYSVTGVGRFIPQSGANPTIGTVDQPEQVEEERIEVNCDRQDLAAIVAAIRAAHPYEEPAIDAYPLLAI